MENNISPPPQLEEKDTRSDLLEQLNNKADLILKKLRSHKKRKAASQ